MLDQLPSRGRDPRPLPVGCCTLDPMRGRPLDEEARRLADGHRALVADRVLEPLASDAHDTAACRLIGLGGLVLVTAASRDAGGRCDGPARAAVTRRTAVRCSASFHVHLRSTVRLRAQPVTVCLHAHR